MKILFRNTSAVVLGGITFILADTLSLFILGCLLGLLFQIPILSTIFAYPSTPRERAQDILVFASTFITYWATSKICFAVAVPNQKGRRIAGVVLGGIIIAFEILIIISSLVNSSITWMSFASNVARIVVGGMVVHESVEATI